MFNGARRCRTWQAHRGHTSQLGRNSIIHFLEPQGFIEGDASYRIYISFGVFLSFDSAECLQDVAEVLSLPHFIRIFVAQPDFRVLFLCRAPASDVSLQKSSSTQSKRNFLPLLSKNNHEKTGTWKNIGKKIHGVIVLSGAVSVSCFIIRRRRDRVIVKSETGLVVKEFGN